MLVFSAGGAKHCQAARFRHIIWEEERLFPKAPEKSGAVAT